MNFTDAALEQMGKAAALSWQSRADPSFTLTRAAVEQIKQAQCDMTREQMERLTTYTNRHAYLDQHQKLAGGHRYVHFDRGPARPEEVVKQATGMPDVTERRDLSDYSQPPSSMQKKASWEQLFGVQKFAFSKEAQGEPSDPWIEVKQLSGTLNHLLKEAASEISMGETEVEALRYELANHIKEAHEQGATLRDIVRVMSSVSDDPGMMKAAWDAAAPKLLPHHTGSSFAASFKTASQHGVVNPEHPLPITYAALIKSATKLAATRQVYKEVSVKLAGLHAAYEKLATNPAEAAAAVAAASPGWMQQAGTYGRKGLDAMAAAGGHVADFGHTLGGQGSVAHRVGQVAGFGVKHLPHLIGAGLLYRGAQHASAAMDSPVGRKIKGLIPGTDENEMDQMRIRQMYGADPYGGMY